ncbi:MAG: gliding motility-associated C-terminal domain-containing protein [Flavobacteriales bacterium]
MKTLIFSAFTILFSVNTFAQLDTLFWFVAPEVAQSHGDRPIVFRFASLNTPATVNITQPANPAFPTQIINLAANDAQTLNLTNWIDIIENKPANTVLPYGFKISATAPIMAYYEVTPTCNCNPDIFALKGKNSLGTQFVIPAQNYLNNASYARSGFNIIATENNTVITIIPKQDIVGHLANIPFTINLQKGQTFGAEAVSTLANLHLSGSTVTSNLPVAITLHDDSMSGAPYGGCADLMGDQLIPNQVIGTDYIVLKGYLNGPDKIYVVAVQNNTQITIDGIPTATINANATYVHTLSNPTVLIQTSVPAHLLHTTGFGCEVGGAVLPSIVCTGSNTVAFVRSTNEFFALNILVPTGGENTFTFNGNTGIINPSMFNFVPGTNNAWKYAQINASSFVGVQTSSRIDNPNFKFHLGVVHGGSSSGCRYGYFSDFAAAQYQINVNDESFCVGETIQLSTNTLTGATYNWSGPNNFSFVGSQYQINQAQLSDAGTYIVSGYLPGTCQIQADTIQLAVYANPAAPTIQTNAPICNGDTVLFWTNDAINSLHWNYNNTSSTLDTLSIYEQIGSFSCSLQVESPQGCFSPWSIMPFDVYDHPQVQYNGPLSICGPQITFTQNATGVLQDPIANYNWYTSIGQLLGSGINFNYNQQSNNSSQEFFIVETVSQLGCIGLDTFNIIFNAFPQANFSAQALCDGLTINLTNTSSWQGTPYPGTTLSQIFLPGDGQQLNQLPSTYSYSTSGNFDATLILTSSANCADTISLPIQLIAVPVISISADDTCGQILQLYADINAQNNQIQSAFWTINDSIYLGNPLSTHIEDAGLQQYSYQITLSNGCSYSSNGSLNMLPSITLNDIIFPNIISTSSLVDNDKWVIDPLFENCATFDLVIVNRWGQEVFKSNKAGQAFEGKNLDGEMLPEGIYFYLFTSGQEKRQGFIHIKH